MNVKSVKVRQNGGVYVQYYMRNSFLMLFLRRDMRL